jgi:hypothetical protein
MRGNSRVLLVAAGTVFAMLVPFSATALTPGVAGAAPSPPVGPTTIYDSTSTPVLPVPSLGFEATSASEAGNLVQFAPGTPRLASSVTVTMDSWGCESGGWTGTPLPCTTTPGATFTEPITLNVYATAPSNGVGAKLVSVTKTFSIPFRPSSDLAHCPDGQTFLYAGSCVHGLPVDVTFNLGDTVLPNAVVWSVVYNTSDYGPSPYGHGTACAQTPYTGGTYDACGYDSLNLGLTVANGPSVGSDPLPGTIYWSTTVAGFYCDGGTAGTGTFRLDSSDDNGAPCWGDASPYTSAPWDIPAVQFNAVPELSVASSNTTSSYGQPVGFTVTGPPTATGSVVVSDGATAIGGCALASGSCTVTNASLTVGPHTISAAYAGGGGFPAATSAAISQSVSAVHPSAPVAAGAVPGDTTATVEWNPPSFGGGSPITGYAVTSLPAGGTCTTTGATSCVVTGLTDGTPYRFAVVASNVAGAGPPAVTRKLVEPATTGFHVYAYPPVIEQARTVEITATGAQASSRVRLSVFGHGTKKVMADAFGGAAARFYVGAYGVYAITAVNTDAVATGTLYVAKVIMPRAMSHRYQIPVTVRGAIPGSTLVVATSTDGTYTLPVPAGGKVIIDLPRAAAGSLAVTVTDDGYSLATRTITIT